MPLNHGSIAGSSISQSLLVVILGNVTLALLALVRESRLAAFAGTTGTADALVLALYFPDLVGNIVLAGGITFAAVPVLSAFWVNRDMAGFRQTLRATMGLVIAITVALAAAAWFAAPFLVNSIGVGLSGSTRDLTGLLLGYLLPGIPFFVLTALLSSALYVQGRFVFPAFGPVVLNLVFLVGLVFLAPIFGVQVLALFFTMGTVAMFLLQLAPLSRSGYLGMPVIDWRDPGLRNIVRQSWPVMAAVLLSQPGGVVEKILASKLIEGSLAGLGYAFKLSQFPIWVFASALGAVIFPDLAACAERKDIAGFRRVLGEGLVLTAFISFPFTAAFLVVGRPMVSLLFQQGAFNIDSLDLTSGVLSTYAVGLGAQGFVYLFVRAFYSLWDMVTPLKAAVVSTVVTVIADVVLVSRWGLPGLGLGASAGAITQAVMLAYLFSRRAGSPRLGHSLWRIGLACLAMAGTMYFSGKLLLNHVETLTLPAKAWRVSLVLGTGAVVYGAACGVLRIKELQPLWSAAGAGVGLGVTLARRVSHLYRGV